MDQELKERAEKIKLVIFDVDGVLTDGSLYYDNHGQEFKAFHSRDGHGMKMLRENGVEIALITGRTSQIVLHRAENLKIEHIYQGQLDKLPAYLDIQKKLGLDADQISYMGDDVVDLPVMTKVGFAVAVQDAHPLVIKKAHWQTPHPGGKGAARDLCELLLKAQEKWDAAMQPYLA